MVIIVDEDDVVAGTVEEVGGDGGVEAGGTVHSQLGVGNLIEAFKQRVQRDVDRPGHVPGGPLIVAAHVEHHRPGTGPRSGG